MLLERNGKLITWKSSTWIKVVTSAVHDEFEIKVVCQVIKFVNYFSDFLHIL